MASVTPSPVPKVRTPRLTYRTKSSDASSFHSLGTEHTRLTSSTQPTSPNVSEFSPLPSPRFGFPDAESQLESRRPSLALSSISSHRTDKTTKKKSGIFSGLFSVKEPSAQALADYQRQMMKQNPSGSKTRTTTVRLPGISSASLPPSVPKVNSKWDGVPQSTKEKEKRQELLSRRSMSIMNAGSRSGASAGSDSSLDASRIRRPKSRDTLGAMSSYSGGSQNRLAGLYGWENTEPSSISTKDGTSDEGDHEYQTFSKSTNASPLHRPTLLVTQSSVPIQLASSDSHQSPNQLPEVPSLPDHSHSPSLTPGESLPGTPGLLSPFDTYQSVSSQDNLSSGVKTTILEAPSSEEVIIQSSGINILGPPASAKRQPVGLPQQRPKTSGMEQRPASVSGTGPASETQASPTGNNSNLKFGQHHRRNSAQDRLSLGMSLRHQAVPPWSWSETHPESKPIASDGKRIFSPSPQEGSQALRKKRLSLFKK